MAYWGFLPLPTPSKQSSSLEGGDSVPARGIQPGPGQNQHPALRWAGFKATPAFLTLADMLSVPAIYPPPSYETSPQDKTRPFAQLAFSSITHEDILPTIIGDGWWPPSSPSLLCSHVQSPLGGYTMQMPQVCSLFSEQRTKYLSEFLILSVTHWRCDCSYCLQGRRFGKLLQGSHDRSGELR